MSKNIYILYERLGHIGRMRADVRHSLGKLPGAMHTIQTLGVEALTPDERETISAFTTRFATYQEHMGKTMRSIAIEEESATEPFGAILALMEKFSILDSAAKWKEVRDLRNSANYNYEHDAQALHQILDGMMNCVPWLVSLHEKLEYFVAQTYPAPSLQP